MNSYESLKSKHSLIGIYSLRENSLVCAELAACGEVFDEVCGELKTMYRECFAATAESYGLSERENIIFNMESGQLATDRRRQILLERLAVTEGDFTLKALEKMLSVYGADFNITENPLEERIVIDAELSAYPQEIINLIIKNILDFIPAHLDAEVVYQGKRWRDIDALDMTFSQMDGKNYTWAQIDALK